MAPRFHFHDAAAALARPLLQLLAPPHCAACDQRLASEAVFCAACSPSLEPPGGGPSPVPLVAAHAYGGALAVAIKRYKYHGHSYLGRPLGMLLRPVVRSVVDGSFAASRAGRASLIVPVPLHPRRLAARGYNQSTALARAVAIELGVRAKWGVLVRQRDTSAQARLGAAARRANVDGAFAVAQPRWVRGRDVVLIDDVTTTGATLAACAAALRRAGAVEVVAVVLARAEISQLSEAEAAW